MQGTKNFGIILLSFFFFFSVNAFSQDTGSVFGPKIFFFRIDSEQLERDFKTNLQAFEALDFLLNMPEVYTHIDSILITGAASPIGTPDHNRALSIARAKAMEAYILWKHPGFDRNRIDEKAAGIDWEGFQSLVSRDAGVPDRGKILYLSGRTQNEELLLRELRSLPPATQRYLRANIFSQLQYVSVRLLMDDGSYIPPLEDSSPLDFFKDLKDFKVLKDLKDTARRDTPVQVPVNKPSHRVFAVSTNLLYDAALLPNLSIELAFNRQSLLLQGAWSWWDTGSPNYWSHRIQMLWIENRYWWGDRPQALTGFFTGIYGAVGTYDVRLFPKGGEPLGFLSNLSYSAGLTGGYSLPLSRRWNLNFNLGVGYLGGEYNEYNHSSCADCYPKRSTKQRRYIGPTQAAVSIVYKLND
ncbi:hypothetical protein AGMMS50239_16680 [Bacteroidia bacterium]|nr:hypothetical protein AGMMS50239_16680 [Bacteroidia bacterium]